MKTNLRIGEVLMEHNYITQEQMEQALAYQKEHREKRVGQILIELGFVTEALAARLGLEIVSIGQMQVDLTAVRMIPRELAEKQNLLAVGFADKSLEVVTNDPLNYFAFEEVRQLTGCQVVIRLSEMGPLQSAIRYYYAEVGAQQAAPPTRTLQSAMWRCCRSKRAKAAIRKRRSSSCSTACSTVPSAPARATCISSRLRAARACACVSTARSLIM